MAKTSTSNTMLTENYSPLLRVQGESLPLHTVLMNAKAEGLPIFLPNNATAQESTAEVEDSAAIDTTLSVAIAPSAPAPQPGTSYAGFTPIQRHAFLAWSHAPAAPAPVAYQQLLLANLEARLLEPNLRAAVLAMLQQLSDSPAWAKHIALHRTMLFACWLLKDGPRLTAWISDHHLPPDLLGIALGIQAQLDAPLTAIELGTALTTWQLGPRLPTDLLKMRLDSLTAILGQPPLAYALAAVEPDALAPRPWRTSHRGLRLLIPQPDLRPLLEPSMRDLLTVADVSPHHITPEHVHTSDPDDDSPPADPDDQPSLEELGWRLILEFGSNRSDYFDYVLMQAQKLPGYSQLMDEDRRIVYRIIFRKSEMRRFWRLWDYVNGWTTARVYLNGNELEKWKVWPYSQYLK